MQVEENVQISGKSFFPRYHELVFMIYNIYNYKINICGTPGLWVLKYDYMERFLVGIHEVELHNKYNSFICCNSYILP